MLRSLVTDWRDSTWAPRGPFRPPKKSKTDHERKEKKKANTQKE